MAKPIKKIGVDQEVNLIAQGSRDDAEITALADGGWLLIWSSDRYDGSGTDVYQQRYDRSGLAVYEVEQIVNTQRASQQHDASAIALADGGWLVTWTSYADEGLHGNIYQQRFDARGQPIGGEVRVNQIVLKTQYQPNVVAMEDGGWLVTWTCMKDIGIDQWRGDVYQQRYSRSGQALYEVERLVNTQTYDTQDEPITTALSDKGWVVTWRSLDASTSASDIYQQRYDASGRSIGSEIKVGAAAHNDQVMQTTAALDDGGWVVAWVSSSDGDVFLQRYDREGKALYEADLLVSRTVDYQDLAPSIAALANGGWVVTWKGSSIHGTWDNPVGDAIYQQVYDRDGNALYTTDQQVSFSPDIVMDPSVAALADGSWVISWKSSFLDFDAGISRQDIHQQRYTLDLPSSPPTKPEVQGAVASVDENEGTQSLVAIVKSAGTNPLSYVLTANPGNRFSVDASGKITMSGAVDFENEPNLLSEADGRKYFLVKVQARETVQGGASSIEESIKVYINDVNEAPFGIRLSTVSVLEASATGSTVGTLSAMDPDRTGQFTYEVLNGGAGGRFKAVKEGNVWKIVVVNGGLLDYEQASSHTIKVRVTDSGSVIEQHTLSVEMDLMIGIGNVHTENVLGAAAHEKFVGGSGNDTFQGRGGNDTLNGGGGKDKLSGGTGNDVLTGGTGRDVFVFSTKPHRKNDLDRITDFNMKDDTIQLENAIFRRLGSKAGTLKKAFFTFGSVAKDAKDYILYDTKTGYLRYDADGSGKGASEIIAKLQPKLKTMSYLDFQVI
ncbi:cadherin domain-containing protein [Microvirga sp. ACRRW]|uniref:cadherin domain-containing protein n=1 Tax=Microvirga sp. ACRRW TaxID=2918205 RepID=UPI00272CDF4B|nr:cadherin domain-containing protein [Microvirga sp. ACRRW]